MSSFSIAWLDLREPADHAARDKALAQQALQWVKHRSGGKELFGTFVDLGSGTGSTVRALMSFGTDQCIWRLVDNNGQLLNEALKRHGKSGLIEDYQMDLNVVDELPLSHAQLVTASALFDLVSRDFIDALVKHLKQKRIGLYAALNYDGTTEWTPTHPLDDAVLAAFNKDQQRDKGFGPALGPHAVNYLQTTLEEAGFNIYTSPSPWVIEIRQPESVQHKLVRELIFGITNAVADGYGLDATALAEWKSFRLENANHGKCIVGHTDFLALPD